MKLRINYIIFGLSHFIPHPIHLVSAVWQFIIPSLFGQGSRKKWCSQLTFR